MRKIFEEVILMIGFLIFDVFDGILGSVLALLHSVIDLSVAAEIVALVTL